MSGPRGFTLALLSSLVVAGCGSDFSLFDPAAPALDARFALDSAGTGRPPITRLDTVNSGITLVADTIIFTPDGQVTRRWRGYFIFETAGHRDSSAATTTWSGQYDLDGPQVRTWLAVGIPTALPESLAWVGDTALIKPDDFVAHARLRYRRVP